MTPRICEFTWYFDQLPEREGVGELIEKLAETLHPVPNAFSILDNSFKERRGRFSTGKISAILAQAVYDETFGLQVFSKIKNEDNRFPRSNVVLSRASVGYPAIYGLTVSTDFVSPEASLENITTWIGIAEGFIAPRYGFGSNRQKFNLDFDYGNRHLMYVENPSDAYDIVASNIRHYRSNLDTFLKLTHGQMIMSIFRYNYMSKTLFDQICELADQCSGDHSGNVVDFQNNQVLWTIPDAYAQHLIFDAASKAGIVFDKGWFSLDDYVPARQVFGIAPG